MDKMTLGGLLLAWGSVLACVLLEGGSLKSFILLPPAILVFGGTLGATFIGVSMHEMKTLPAKLILAFKGKHTDYHALIALLVDFATRSRRDGVLALEEQIEQQKDEFLVKGLQMLVDGVDQERIRETLETDISSLKVWYKEGEEFFKQMGGYGPTLGIIGTVFGLITMLSNLSNAESMGPAIASAFIATMYGISSANLIYLPFSNKIKNVGAIDILEKKIILEGLLCIQAGVSPRMSEQALLSYIYPEKKKSGEGEKKGGA